MLKSKVRIGERKKFVKATEVPKVSHALEDYLKSIYQLAEESQPVIAARIAAETGVSPSTIFTTLQRLAREGYVTINRHKEIHLTQDGKTVAERIVRRHFLTERFLTDLLGLLVGSEGTLGVISKVLLKLIPKPVAKKTMVATFDAMDKAAQCVSDIIAAQIIPCTLEFLDRDVRLLSFLQEHGMRPGAKVHVLDVAPSLGMMTLKVGAEAFSLGLEAAKKIRVH